MFSAFPYRILFVTFILIRTFKFTNYKIIIDILFLVVKYSIELLYKKKMNLILYIVFLQIF